MIVDNGNKDEDGFLKEKEDIRAGGSNKLPIPTPKIYLPHPLVSPSPYEVSKERGN